MRFILTMDVKWMVSAGKIEDIQKGSKGVNPARYNAFHKTFGEGNVGLVSMDQVVRELRTGKPADVYVLGNNLEVKLSEEKGINSNLFLASGFDLGKGRISKREDLEEVMGHLELEKSRGNIRSFVNSQYSTLFEDKISFVGLAEKGMHVPHTYNFLHKNEFQDFIQENGKHVVKHRFGYDGINNFLIDKNNLNLLDGESISDYVVQELVPIVSETRMIFYGDEFLGARKIIDRTRPWEKKATSGRIHSLEPYSPTNEETARARAMFNYADGIVGAVDTVQLSDGREMVLEVNGVATGLGGPDGVYDLNTDVAKRLKESYIDK